MVADSLPHQHSRAVQPDTLGQRGHVLGAVRGGNAQQSTIGGGLELHHLRDYRPGDPRHTIDWKASARKAETRDPGL